MSSTPGTAAPPPSRLLALPAELRNRIYLFTLHETRHIHIDSTYQQPALLQACRKTRAEASSIYYMENKFIINCHDFDVTTLQCFENKSEMFSKTEWLTHVSIDIGAQATSWGNLLEWLRRYYHKESTGYSAGLQSSGTRKAASRLFAVALQLHQHMDWEQAKTILLEMKDGLEEQAEGSWRWS